MEFPKDNNSNQARGNIGRLTEFSDYQVADHNPDVRGWQVIGADGSRYGEVKDLIVDCLALKTRYLEIKAYDSLPPGAARHLLVPIGMASLDENRDLVYLGQLDRSTFAQLPPYHGGPVTQEYEHTIQKVLRIDPIDATAQNTVPLPISPHAGAVLGTPPLNQVLGDAEFYSHAYFDENTFYGSRRKRK